MRAARLDLNKDDRAAIDGDQVDLAQSTPIAASDDPISGPSQVSRRGALAALTQRVVAAPRDEQLAVKVRTGHGSPERKAPLA
jgi:hypothetical protein